MVKALENNRLERTELRGANGRDYELLAAPLTNQDGTIDKAIEVVQDITERKRTEKALRESENKYRRLAENSPDMIYRMSLPDGKYEYVSPAATAIFGYPPEAWYENPLLIREIMHSDWHPYFKDQWDRLLKGDVPLTYEYQIVHKDSTVRWINQRNVLVKGEDSRPVAIEGVVTDITERKRIEKALQKAYDELEWQVKERTGELISINEQLQQEIIERQQAQEQLALFHQFVEASREGMGWADLDGRVRYINSALCSMFGETKPEDSYGKPVLEYYSEETQRRLQDEIFPTVLQEGTWTGELVIHSLTGNLIPTTNSLVVLRDTEGNPSSFANVLTDLTERKQAEEELRRHRDHLEEIVAERTSALKKSNQKLQQEIIERKKIEEALRESEKLYRLLADNVTDVIWVRDMNLRLTYVSPSVTNQTGHTIEEAMVRTLEEALPPDSLKLAVEVFSEELEIEKRKQKDLFRSRTMEVEIKCKDGSTIWTEVKMSFLRDQLGNATGIIGVTRDITDRKYLETQLQQAQRMEAIGTLAGGIAHDFNNILSAIIGFTEMSIIDLERGSWLFNNLQKVLKAGERAKDLVSQILAFSRQSDIKPKPVHVKLIAQEALKLLRATLPTTIEIHQNLRSNSAAMADPTQLHQIIMNLCSNAGGTMQEKGGKLGVNIIDVNLDSEFINRHHDMNPGPYIKLTVSDTGCGMPPEVVDRIFDPFFTTKEKGEGTGMGLSVVHGIIKSFGGTITVDSEVDKGSTFNVYIPVIEAEAVPEVESVETLLVGNESILFVDDEDLQVDLGKQMLERLGYKVVARTSSIEALELFRIKPNDFDLVITDMTMPSMTGDALAQQLMLIRPDIPIILCTGYSELISEEKASKIGIRAFVMKPIVMKDIAETIRKVLDEV